MQRPTINPKSYIQSPNLPINLNTRHKPRSLHPSTLNRTAPSHGKTYIVIYHSPPHLTLFSSHITVTTPSHPFSPQILSEAAISILQYPPHRPVASPDHPPTANASLGRLPIQPRIAKFQFHQDHAVSRKIPLPPSHFETETPRLRTSRMVLCLDTRILRRHRRGRRAPTLGLCQFPIFGYPYDYVRAPRSAKGIRVCRSAVTFSIIPSISRKPRVESTNPPLQYHTGILLELQRFPLQKNLHSHVYQHFPSPRGHSQSSSGGSFFSSRFSERIHSSSSKWIVRKCRINGVEETLWNIPTRNALRVRIANVVKVSARSKILSSWNFFSPCMTVFEEKDHSLKTIAPSTPISSNLLEVQTGFLASHPLD